MNRPKYILLILMCLTIFSSCFTPRKGPQRRYDTAVEQGRHFDAVIIPGIPFANGSWDSVMKARVIWSWVLYKNGIAKNIIYSGGHVYTPFIEAYIMGLYGQALGIPKEHIFYDTLARHSTENVYYSYKLAKQLKFKSLALATDPFQSYLLKSFTRKRFSTTIYHIPFITDTLKAYQGLAPQIKPLPALRLDGFQSITDSEGFMKRLRGTLGKDIDWDEYKNGKLGPL
ncbi:MAG: YdcF family protein [Sphingobacteriales bacterium]|nr:MAG: YdcF family protein [Sphingobacteriales bacterium]